jgi:Putative prokaryotic signal transducing protein
MHTGRPGWPSVASDRAGDHCRRAGLLPDGVKVSEMAELVRTNDAGVLSVIEGLLGGAGIPYEVTDRNMSILDGSISAIQIRILVPDEHEAEARELLIDAELGNWLHP